MKRVAALAKEAAGVPSSTRRAFLLDRSSGDTDLADSVLEVLAAQDSATLTGEPMGTAESGVIAGGASGLFEESPAPARGNGPPEGMAGGALPRPGLPTTLRLGRYTILDLLGEGGMGAVYLAQQESPRRTVALKVIRAGLLTARMLKRFEHESEVLGRLQHPGIAQIYEAATARTNGQEQPYFAMELVRGEALTAHAASRGLGVREKLALFMLVCDAVHHAHQKGVIHRDLKPANILVDQSGQPKILDFGVARAATGDQPGATLRTEAGALIGTIPYMSPEQISGDPNDLDTRSDVYTLGVILYEMLTGGLPHRVSDKTIPEAVRIIGEDEPAPLSVSDRSLRGDVQTIVGKALEKDKTRRYQSASDLAADLGRYLRDEPILARQPSTFYLWGRFAKRNKALVGGVAATIGVLAAGVVASSVLAIRATRAEEGALREAANAKAVSGFVTGMFEAIDPETGKDRDITVREVLAAAALDAETLAVERPEVGGRVLITLATTFKSIGRLDEAEEKARGAVDALRRRYGDADADVISAELNLAGILSERSKAKEATALAESVLRRLEGPLGAARPRDRAIARAVLGRVLLEQGNSNEGEPTLARAVDELRTSADPKDPRHQREFLTHLDNWGSALTARGALKDAEVVLREVRDLRTKAFGAEHPSTAYSMVSLANVLQKQGQNDEAFELLSDALRIRRARLEPTHPSVLITLSNLAVAYIGAGRQAEALPLLKEAAEGSVKTLGEGNRKTLVVLGILGYCLEDLGHLDEAEATYERVIAQREKAGQMADPETWGTMNNLAMLLNKRGKTAAAAAKFEEILALQMRAVPEDHFYIAIFRSNYAEVLTTLARYGEAETALQKAIPVLEKTFKSPGHARVQQAVKRMVALYEAWRKPAEAATWRAKIAP
ncbi:MAG: protein kinase domain-containing protein [Phycisphaerales bacterium]